MQACPWPPALSDLRLACEECHKRKIRCEPPVEGSQGTCQACCANRRNCLFSLKNKTGRPRKNKRTTPSRISIHSGQTSHTTLQLQPASHECVSPTPTTTTVSDHASGDPYHVERLPTAQVHASAQLAMNYVNSLFSADNSAPGPGDERYLMDLARPLSHPENAPPSDSFDLEAPSMDHWMITPQTIEDLSSEERLPESHSRDRAPPPAPTNKPDAAQGGEPGDFLEAIRFFCETSNHRQGDLLNIQASSDKHTLLLILGNIEELGQKTAVVVAQEAGAGTSCQSGVGNRQNQYIRMLTRVAVMGAFDIVDDLVKYNMGVHNIAPSGVHEVEHECVDNVGGAALVSNNTTDDALEGVLSLVRLDFALRQFSLFLSTDQGDVDRCQSSSNNIVSDMAYGCREGKSGAGTPTLARMAQTRRQLWALVGCLRDMW